MTTINFQKRIDADLLKKADEIYEQLGTTTGEVFRMFLAKTVEVQGFPFELKIDREPSSSELKKWLQEAINLRNQNFKCYPFEEALKKVIKK
ncbi:MAG: type II toxin-antitoxin system RelB/DinJ family antitoxin [Lactobacillales bacterium]|jgi:addiction module RelB/DinJ family antitoxin|nr:type II toxin-antitoxin system RelB/DinJ family antitoxin [Lactobacillales bacterium]